MVAMPGDAVISSGSNLKLLLSIVIVSVDGPLGSRYCDSSTPPPPPQAARPRVMATAARAAAVRRARTLIERP
jgi:hypothetical protein